MLDDAQQRLLLRLSPAPFGDDRAAWAFALARRTRSGVTPPWREPTPTQPGSSWRPAFETCLRIR